MKPSTTVCTASITTSLGKDGTAGSVAEEESDKMKLTIETYKQHKEYHELQEIGEDLGFPQSNCICAHKIQETFVV